MLRGIARWMCGGGWISVGIRSRSGRDRILEKLGLGSNSTIRVSCVLGGGLTPSSVMSFQVSPTTSVKISLRALVRGIRLTPFDTAWSDQFIKIVSELVLFNGTVISIITGSYLNCLPGDGAGRQAWPRAPLSPAASIGAEYAAAGEPVWALAGPSSVGNFFFLIL